MAARRQNAWRSFFASFCLAALVLLYASLGGAAWSLYSAACCTTAQCPIKGHHHQHAPAAPGHAMDCGHEMAGMSSCSMSCCQNPDRPALGAIVFVLPAPATVSVHVIFEPFIPLPSVLNFLRSIEPLSPPPRISARAA